MARFLKSKLVLALSLLLLTVSIGVLTNRVHAQSVVQSTVCNSSGPFSSLPTISSPASDTTVAYSQSTVTISGSTFPNIQTSFADNGQTVSTLSTVLGTYNAVIALQVGTNHIVVSAVDPCTSVTGSASVNVSRDAAPIPPPTPAPTPTPTPTPTKTSSSHVVTPTPTSTPAPTPTPTPNTPQTCTSTSSVKISSPSSGVTVTNSQITVTGTTFPNAQTTFSNNGQLESTLNSTVNSYSSIIPLESGQNMIVVSATNPCTGSMSSATITLTKQASDIISGTATSARFFYITAIIFLVIIIGFIFFILIGKRRKKDEDEQK